jgi:hypothetical protein
MRFPRYPKNNQTRATRRQIKSNRLPKSAQKKIETNKQNKQETRRRKPKSPRRPLTTQKMLRNWNSFQILTITDKRADQILWKKTPRDAKNKKFTSLLLPGFLLPLLLGRRLALCFERAPKTLFHESFC